MLDKFHGLILLDLLRVTDFYLWVLYAMHLLALTIRTNRIHVLIRTFTCIERLRVDL